MSHRLQFAKAPKQFDRQMAYLFAADRFDHLHNEIDGILKTLDSGCWVISTRYYFSSLAYHCVEPSDWSFVRAINRAFPPPDLLVYLRNPVSVSIGRMKSRKALDAYENEAKLDLVAKNYEKILRAYRGRKLICDAQAKPETLQQIISDYVKTSFMVST